MSENYWYSSLSGQEIEDTLVGAVRGDIDQNQTTSWKARARANIGAGEANSTFKILGYFDTLQDLQEWLQVLPQSGDAYGIGTESPYDVYVWDGVHNVWVNNGPIAYSDALIDDNDISIDHVWSSSKTNTEVSAAKSLANAAQSAADAAQTTADGKAPTNHASTATTYGVGNASNYGHVKLSDTPDASKDAGDGVAATPAAVQAAIDKATWTLLWTNPNPTSQFSPQTISLNTDGYSMFLLIMRRSPASGIYSSTIALKGFEHSAMCPANAATQSIVYRAFTIANNSCTFEAGYTTTDSSGSPSFGIPYQIYGIKA